MFIAGKYPAVTTARSAFQRSRGSAGGVSAFAPGASARHTDPSNSAPVSGTADINPAAATPGTPSTAASNPSTARCTLGQARLPGAA